MSRVLIFGHNPFSKELPNGRTLLELFAHFKKNELAELYIHPDVPNFDVCNNYYRITDFDMLKKGIFRMSTGKKVELSQEDKKNDVDGDRTKVYKIGSKRSSFAVMIRNIIWKIGKWFSKDLKKWIKEFNPDVLFFYLGNYSFTIDIALKISSYYKIPIVTYIVDDYYFNHDLKKGFFGVANHHLYSKKLHKLLNGRTVICINDYMKSQYSSEFKCDYYTIYTVSSLQPFKSGGGENAIIQMSYLGGVACERYKSLIDIGKVIADNKLPINFSVYTRETRDWLIEPLKSARGIKLCEPLNYKGVIDVMEKSDILVHVEGFSDYAIKLVKYSLSTKIADILSCNRCLLAYGSEEVASIKYLIDSDCAYVATSIPKLIEILFDICSNRNLLFRYENNAMRIAQQNHSSEENYKKIRKIFNSVVLKDN